MIDKDFGYITIKIEEMRQKKGLSKNKLKNGTGMQTKQLNKYCKGEIQRMDLTLLTRLCYNLECTIPEILEYVSPRNENLEQ